MFDIDHTYTVEVNGLTFTSTIDHFCFDEGISNAISDAGVLYLPGNFSDHCPIYCKIKIDGLVAQPQCDLDIKKKVYWNKALSDKKARFTECLKEELERITVPVCCETCNNVHCDNPHHRLECDNFLQVLVQSLDISAITHLPSGGGKSKKTKPTIPLCKEEIKPFKEKAVFWHSIWVSAGKPVNNQLHHIMKRTKTSIIFSLPKAS